MAKITGRTTPAPHGTQEWAASNVNIQDGCEHDCRYCYAKTMAIRFKRATARTWARPRLRQHDVDRRYTKRRDGRINRLRQIIPNNCPGKSTAMKRAISLMATQNDATIRALYERHKHDPLVKWKDSIKKVVGLDRPETSGMDV